MLRRKAATATAIAFFLSPTALIPTMSRRPTVTRTVAEVAIGATYATYLTRHLRKPS